MTVYVDDLRTWNGKEWCELVATSLDELDYFAVVRLHLKLVWKQTNGRYTHYDLTPRLRHDALVRGAKYMPTRELLKRIRPMEEKEKETDS